MISDEIVAGRLKPGDRLPPEHALSETFGVSRNVVREAIAKLRSDGVVRSRQGVGAFVVRSEANPTLRIDAESLGDREVFANIFEIRAILEIRAAGIAAERASPEQVDVIALALQHIRDARNWVEGGVDADLEFHRAVALATGNPQIAMVINFLSGQLREIIMATRARLGPVLGEARETSIAEHTAIYRAIAGRAPPAARKAMEQHITRAALRLGIERTLTETG